MADRILENFGLLSGEYNDIPFEDSRSSVVSVRLVDVPFTKVADQSIWFSGELTLTFTIDNTAGEGPLEQLVIQDTLDTTKFLYVANSVIVQVNTGGTVVTLVPVTDYTVTYTGGSPTGLLEVAFVPGAGGDPLPVGSIATISFRGTKVAA